MHAADGFVAIRDINPIAETHLLVLPAGTSTRSATSTRSRTRRPHACSASSPTRPRAAGLEDYHVLVNVGARGGQTIFHLHWHVLGGRFDTEQVVAALELETA